MHELKRVDAWSLAKMQGLLGLIFGFILGLVMALITSMLASITPIPLAYSYSPLTGSLLLLIMTPLLYGLIGLISGILIAVFYNFLANSIGGIKISLNDLEKPRPERSKKSKT